MIDNSGRNWNRTYVAVIAAQAVALLALWWLQRYFGI